MSREHLACVGLGANLGDAPATLRAALAALGAQPGMRVLRASSLYRTPAWGLREQPDFINAAAVLATSLDAPSLLARLLAIESTFGRRRAADGSDRWGPRTLDLDLLLFDEEAIDVPGLCVPHPRLHERAFALVPLAEIAPDARIPGIGPVRDVLAALEVTGIEAIP